MSDGPSDASERADGPDETGPEARLARASDRMLRCMGTKILLSKAGPERRWSPALSTAAPRQTGAVAWQAAAVRMAVAARTPTMRMATARQAAVATVAVRRMATVPEEAVRARSVRKAARAPAELRSVPAMVEVASTLGRTMVPPIRRPLDGGPADVLEVGALWARLTLPCAPPILKGWSGGGAGGRRTMRTRQGIRQANPGGNDSVTFVSGAVGKGFEI